MKKIVKRGVIEHPTTRKIVIFVCDKCGAIFKTNEIVRQFVDYKPQYVSACPMCGHPCIVKAGDVS